MPAEYRADQVVRLYGPDNKVSAAVIVEVQLGRDARKRRSWPDYLTSMYARLGCPAMLLVIAPDERVAAWARQRIEIGHPDFGLTPIVLSSAEIPRSFDSKAVLKLPELAVLSALIHVERDAISRALGAIDGMVEDDRKLYVGFIQHALRTRADPALTLEDDMEKLKYDQARMEAFGIEWAQIMENNRQAAAEDKMLIAILEAKLGSLNATDRKILRGIYESSEVYRVVRAVANLTDPEAIRAVLAETEERGRLELY